MTVPSPSNLGFSKAVTPNDVVGNGKLESGEWDEEETHLREAGPGEMEEVRVGGRSWGQRVQGWCLLGEAEANPDSGRGTSVHGDSGKPPGSPWNLECWLISAKGFHRTAEEGQESWNFLGLKRSLALTSTVLSTLHILTRLIFITRLILLPFYRGGD